MEILRFFGFQSSCFKANDYSKLENEENDTKFLLNYGEQLKSISDFSQYDEIFSKFENLVNEYKKNNKFDDSILKKPIVPESKRAAFKKKLKKRSAYNANITVINEEDETDEARTDIKKSVDETNFFFKSDEIVTGNIKNLKNTKLLQKQQSIDVPDVAVIAKNPKKKHRPSRSFNETETTQYLDAESVIQSSTTVKSSKKKRKSGSKKSKKKKMNKSSDKMKTPTVKMNSSSVFHPVEENVKQENIKFVKTDAEIPFDLKKVKKEHTKKVIIDLSKPSKKESKTVKIRKASLGTVERKSSKGKVEKLKSLLDNMAKKTKEKIKLELVGTKEKIPRVSDSKGIDKRKSRLSVSKQKSKRKSANGVKAFITNTLLNKEKIKKLNELKKNLVQKTVSSNNTANKTLNKNNVNKLDVLASKCVTLKKLNSTAAPLITKKNLNSTISSKPAKDFIALNKLKTQSKVGIAKKNTLNNTMNTTVSSNKSLFYPSNHEQTSQHVYRALNDFAVEQLKNKNFTTLDQLKNNMKSQAKTLNKKPMLGQLSRHGSTSTISSYSSLDSNTSISSNTSSINEQTFKSANSKFSYLNSTVSSIMTNDKSYKSVNQTTNKSNFNNSVNHANKNNLVNKQIPSLKPASKANVTIASTNSALESSKKTTLKIPPFKKYLPVPEQKLNHPKMSESKTTTLLLQPAGSSKIPAIQLIKQESSVDYNVDDLQSGDETDDDEEPNKPIPAWANMKLITERVCQQNHNMINFTKLFTASAEQIDLCNIFTIQRNRFKARTSSAHWPCPPVWQTEGIQGDESFRNQ